MLPDKPKESDTKRNGFLSYGSEWHAFSLGVFDGMKTFGIKPKEMRDNPDVKEEPHYYTGGYVIGTILQLIVTVVAGGAALSFM